MGNGYGSYRCTCAADLAAFDRLPPQMREVLRHTVGDWGAPPILRELRGLFEVTGSRRRAMRIVIDGIRRSEAADTYRYYGPHHPEADAGGKKLRRARNAAW